MDIMQLLITLLEGKDGWKHGFWIRDIEKAKLQEGADRRKKIRGENVALVPLRLVKWPRLHMSWELILQMELMKR